jgi:hypothetical protein
MAHEWIIDVLLDLRTFAVKNDMNALAAQLDDTKLMAAIEIASKTEGPAVDTVCKNIGLRTSPDALGASKRAS